MNAISLWQPWASAMAMGLKANETRFWRTYMKGNLVICSAQRRLSKTEKKQFDHLLKRTGTDLPYGFALCVVDLFECIPASEGLELSETEWMFGDYGYQRWVWRTRNLRRFSKPFPVKGKQGFFQIDNSLVEAAL